MICVDSMQILHHFSMGTERTQHLRVFIFAGPLHQISYGFQGMVSHLLCGGDRLSGILQDHQIRCCLILALEICG